MRCLPQAEKREQSNDDDDGAHEVDDSIHSVVPFEMGSAIKATPSSRAAMKRNLRHSYQV